MPVALPLIGAAAGLLAAMLRSPAQASAAEAPAALSPAEFRTLSLVNAYDESHDTKVLRFAFPEADMKSGLTFASCVVLRFSTPEGKEVVRPYTPISKLSQRGTLDIMVKKYKGSLMGTHLHSLKRGDTVDVKGPFVKLPIRPKQYGAIGMLAGGTGIAPMYQVIQEMSQESPSTQLSLVYASRRKEDVLLGNELNEYMEKNPAFSVYYVLSQPPPSWLGGIGHINEAIIRAFMPPPGRTDSVILVCGPPSFMETISGDKDFKSSPPAQGELAGLLKQIGYTQKQVFKF